MRCLYCGKGLAFLKRWTSGGEFCSDAHRQRYQEEYNQLALNRLLQAKPLVLPDTSAKAKISEANPDPKPGLKAAEAKRVEETPLPPRQVHAEPVRQEPIRLGAVSPATQTAITQMAVTQTAPSEPVREPDPVEAKAEPEPVAPAKEAGFLIEFPEPAKAAAPAPSVAKGDFLIARSPALPQREYSPGESTAPLAEQVTLPSFHRVMDCVTRPREGRLEVRVFVRATPIVGVGLRAAGEAGIEDAPKEPLDVPFPLQPPPAPAAASRWQESYREFAAFAVELGELTRLDFPTTGLPEVIEAPSEAAQPLAPPASMVIVDAAALVALKPAEAAVEALEEKPPVKLPGIELQPLPGGELQPIPEVVTRPAPLILHGLPAGRAKPVQVFPPALSSSASVGTPRMDALPLRPVMILEKAPAAAGSVAVKANPLKQPEIVPRAAEVKVRESEPARTPAPPAAPYSEPDLGLPTLSLAGSQNFWSRMPAGVKASVAAIALVLAGGVILVTAKSAGAKAAHAPYRLEAGVPVPVGEADWINDFAPDLSRARQRQVSVLRGSLPLADYRVDFQAQIENKAIGWVFRAKDARNFYAMKLEIEKPEPDSMANLVSFAVINGEEQPRKQTPLPMIVRPDTVYKIRVEAIGDHFITWVQDQKVDEWTDGQIRVGGAGLYNERGERGSVKGSLIVTPLIRRK